MIMTSFVLMVEEERTGDGGGDDRNDDEDEGDFAEFAENTPDENDGNERDEPDNERVDAEIIADGLDGIGGAIHNLLTGFGDLVDVDFGGVFDNVFHMMLALDYNYDYNTVWGNTHESVE